MTFENRQTNLRHSRPPTSLDVIRVLHGMMDLEIKTTRDL